MKQQTTLQKLKQKLYLIIISNNHSREFELALESVIDDINENFLKKEEEQIRMAFNDGKINSVLNKRDSEQYYNEVYGVEGSPDTSSPDKI
jgi:hypothetical protein